VSDNGKPVIEQNDREEPVGSWAETRDFRIELTLAATAAQRLEWLEQAIMLAHKSGALPRPR
jgi:hypothetical protein